MKVTLLHRLYLHLFTSNIDLAHSLLVRELIPAIQQEGVNPFQSPAKEG